MRGLLCQNISTENKHVLQVDYDNHLGDTSVSQTMLSIYWIILYLSNFFHHVYVQLTTRIPTHTLVREVIILEALKGIVCHETL